MLDQAVALLKNIKVETKIEPRLELNISAYLPSSYIAAQDQKIDFYQKIYSAVSLEELAEIEEELLDRFASPPEPGRLLLQVARIRVRAAEAGIELISRRKNSVVLEFSSATNFNPSMLDQHPSLLAKRMIVTGRRPLQVKITGLPEGTAFLENLLAEIESIVALKPA